MCLYILTHTHSVLHTQESKSGKMDLIYLNAIKLRGHSGGIFKGGSDNKAKTAVL
jgi:hypothetical protein